MRLNVALISILFAAAAVSAQALEQPSDLQIVKYTWAKERIDWHKDPHGKRTEIWDDPRTRRGSALEERQARENKRANEKPPDPPRYVFRYKVTVVNSGLKAIAEIDWDYVFTDAMTDAESSRREFTSVEKIGAGKRKELSVLVSSAPTKRISVYALGKGERDGLNERVIIRRVLYEDGTIWQVPEARMDQ